MKNKSIPASLVLLMSLHIATAQQVVKILDLKDCINIALEKSTAVLKGNNNIALAGSQVLAAWAIFA
jgi:hypothetical protein